MYTVYFYGNKYHVPSELTIMSAMEYVGYDIVRGCGCRHGVCGACAVVYRMPGEQKIKTALACQKQVEDGMYVMSMASFDAGRNEYDLDEMEPTGEAIRSLYPQVEKCIGCNACTEACPVHLNPMKYVALAKNRKLQKAAEESFECISCGMCSLRCPAFISHAHIGRLVRRLVAVHDRAPSKKFQERIRDNRGEEERAALSEMLVMSDRELTSLYNNRTME